MLASATPTWLLQLTADSIATAPFPLHNVLQDSCYYPASGNDTTPIALLSRYTPSFVHVDYSLPKAEVRRQLLTPGCFVGYELVGMREVVPAEMTPAGWKPIFQQPKGHRDLPASANPANSFAIWAVYARQGTHGPNHGAERFSLLHLHAEGVAAYDALYRGNGYQAKYVAIINPGEGYGDNWTRFTEPANYLHQVVMKNQLGPPAYLAFGGGGSMEHYARQACWPEYKTLVMEKAYLKNSGTENSNSEYLTVWAID